MLGSLCYVCVLRLPGDGHYLQVISILLSLVLVDRVGRKKLLLCGTLIMTAALFTLAAVNECTDIVPRSAPTTV